MRSPDIRTAVPLSLLVFVVGAGVGACGAPEPDSIDSVTLAAGAGVPGRVDFDHDGFTDLVLHRGSDGRTTIHYGASNGIDTDFSDTLPTTLDVPDGSGWTDSTVADFDLDGKADIVWHNGITGETQIWFMDNTTRVKFKTVTARTTTPDPLLTAAAGWKLVGAEDFDRNGEPDLLFHNGLTGETQIWHMIVINGRSKRMERLDAVSLPASLNIPDNTGWRIGGLNTFSVFAGAGILWYNVFTGQMSIWLMDDATLFRWATPSQFLPGNGMADVVATDDRTGDGWPEIVWHNNQDGAFYVWSFFMDETLVPVITPRGVIHSLQFGDVLRVLDSSLTVPNN